MATQSSSTQALSLLRKLYRELRPTLPLGQKHVSDTSHWKYIMSLARSSNNNSQDEQQTFKLIRLGQNYLGYLTHSRRHGEIIEKYQGSGERTPEQIATQLGFRMPHSEAPPSSDANSNTQQNASSYSQ